MLANTLVVSGIVILVASLFPVRKLIGQLPDSPLRTYWKIMALLISLFMLGYAIVLILFWQHFLLSHTHDLPIPVILFFGSIFVWLSCTLSLRTALDLRRMALLEKESITDPLIGIYNKRYLNRRLADEVARAKRHAQPLSILMVDIDHFKSINDRFGHQAGDLTLSYLGDLILDSIRQFDIAARFGGEEIVIIAPNTTAHAARELAERLRRMVESHELGLVSETRQHITISLTVSIGVASLNLTSGTPEMMIAESDQAMYEAKQQGRNRVVMFRERAPAEA